MIVVCFFSGNKIHELLVYEIERELTNMEFKVKSNYEPTGDQPSAIEELSRGIENGEENQVLLGVTGSGKTFTMAKVMEKINRPTLVLSHNKTLVAQLYGEFRQYFPDNAVEYFVSYYDYYQPEAYMPVSDTYIEKDLSINEQIEKLRLKTTTSLLSGRRDVLVVASVSCIYGMGNPVTYKQAIIPIKKGDVISRQKLLHKLVDSLYSRNTGELSRGTFRVSGEIVDIYPAYADSAFRIYFWGDEVENIEVIDPLSGKADYQLEQVQIYPANLFVTGSEDLQQIIREIQDDMVEQTDWFKKQGRYEEANRLEERVTYDIEMIRELGYCQGIENYSRYFDRRNPGQRPFCLLDYFPDDYVMFIDESHVTIPQIHGMFGGDRSRKSTLVDYGFRLPAAMDNRPQSFEEFESLVNQVVYVSATPGEYELRKTGGSYTEQVVRPTGLLDPVIEVRPSQNQIDDLMEEIDKTVKRNERVLVTTLTKRMAEELKKYLEDFGVKCRYMHSEVHTLDRVDILRDLRLGKFDVLIGINLLREGLDLPEVSLVTILDADKEGFLRSETSLTQIAGRAARNVEGRVIMYADRVTKSMQKTIDETNRRREKQVIYNEKHGITPQTITKTEEEIMGQTSVVDVHRSESEKKEYEKQKVEQASSLVADPVVQYMNPAQIKETIASTRKKMEKASADLDFHEAARLRDEMYELQKLLKQKEG